MGIARSLRHHWKKFSLLICLGLLNYHQNTSTVATTTISTHQSRLLDQLTTKYKTANKIANFFSDPSGLCRNCNRTWVALRKRQAHIALEQLKEQPDEEGHCPLLSSTVRKPSRTITSNTPRAAICAIARNESLYLDEWMTYHRSVAGFSEIFLFDNSRPDGMELLNSSRYVHCEGISIVPWPKADAPQLDAYDVCVYMIREQNNQQASKQKKVSHVAFIDIDEFIVLKNEKETVVDVLQDLVPSQSSHLRLKRSAPVSLAINWVSFGTSNHTKYMDKPVTKRFQYKTYWKGRDDHVKSIVLLDAIRDAGNPHFAFIKKYVWRKFYTVISNGTKVQNNSPFVPGGATDRIVVHHYTLKSLEELHFKGCIRGRADLPTTHEAHKGRCKDKNQIFVGDVFDDGAWKALIKWVPAYGTLYKD